MENTLVETKILLLFPFLNLSSFNRENKVFVNAFCHRSMSCLTLLYFQPTSYCPYVTHRKKSPYFLFTLKISRSNLFQFFWTENIPLIKVW